MKKEIYKCFEFHTLSIHCLFGKQTWFWKVTLITKHLWWRWSLLQRLHAHNAYLQSINQINVKMAMWLFWSEFFLYSLSATASFKSSSFLIWTNAIISCRSSWLQSSSWSMYLQNLFGNTDLNLTSTPIAACRTHLKSLWHIPAPYLASALVLSLPPPCTPVLRAPDYPHSTAPLCPQAPAQAAVSAGRAHLAASCTTPRWRTKVESEHDLRLPSELIAGKEPEMK